MSVELVQNNKVEFYKLDPGTLFIFNNEVYLKTRLVNVVDQLAVEAVSLSDGSFKMFSEKALVNPQKGDLELDRNMFM